MNPTLKGDPSTPAEWQEAVNLADFYLTVDAARQYGLVEGGPVVNAERCASILGRGAEQGIRPRKDNTRRTIAELNP